MPDARPPDVFSRLRESATDVSNALDAGMVEEATQALTSLNRNVDAAEHYAMNGNGARPPLRAVPSTVQAEDAQNLEAEESVIGAMLMAPAAIRKASEQVEATDFYRASHGILFDAIVNLDAAGSPADTITLVAQLEQTGTLATAGGKERVHELAALVPASANVAHYARIVRTCALQRKLARAFTTTPQNLDALTEAATDLAKHEVVGKGKEAIDGADWLQAQPEGCPAVWGTGDRVLWAQGEPLMIYGPDGVGKTTLAQQVVLHMCGLRADTLLTFHVERQERPVMYLACDRPLQARRSIYRMVPADRREDLRGRLKVWQGPLPFSIPQQPRALLDFCLMYEVGALVIDSLKDVAVDLTKPETALRVCQAFQWLMANGVELLILHHPRKDPAGQPARAKTLEDVYGDRNFTATMGSVISLYGKAGDPIVTLEHLKQPASEVGPMKILHDHDQGRTEPYELKTLTEIIGNSPRPMTVTEIAGLLYASAEPSKNEVEKARRELRKLSEKGVVLEFRDTETGTLSFGSR